MQETYLYVKCEPNCDRERCKYHVKRYVKINHIAHEEIHCCTSMGWCLAQNEGCIEVYIDDRA